MINVKDNIHLEVESALNSCANFPDQWITPKIWHYHQLKLHKFNDIPGRKQRSKVRMKQDFFSNDDIHAAYNTCTRHDYQEDQVPQFDWKVCDELIFSIRIGVVNDIVRNMVSAAVSCHESRISRIPSKGHLQVA